jgi:nicotinamidase-related amidase
MQNLPNGLHGRFFRIARSLFRGSPKLTKLEELKMQALLVVDVQNEFSGKGLRAVPNHEEALRRIAQHVEEAREAGRPIAWVQHFNKPHESKAFVPGTWGSQLSPGMGPQSKSERLFTKDVYGAFYAEGLEDWLNELGVRSVLIVGFYAHMCVSTSVREALIRGLDVFIDPEATGARDLEHPVLGSQSADEVRRSALLQLTNMGAQVFAKARRAKRRSANCTSATPEAELSQAVL